MAARIKVFGLALLLLVLLLLICLGAMLTGRVLHGDVLAYVIREPRTGRTDVYVIDTTTRLTHNMTGEPTYDDLRPMWSPDGEWLAFISRRLDGVRRLYLIEPDGDNLKLLTAPRPDARYDDFPYRNVVWTDDSDSLITMRIGPAGVGARTHIYRVPVPSGGAELLDPDDPDAQAYIPTVQRTFHPAPIGDQSYYISYTDNQWGISIVEADGNERLLLPLLGDEIYLESPPAWSPDGTRLAVTLLRTGTPELYIVDVRTGDLTRLTTTGGAQPHWRP